MLGLKSKSFSNILQNFLKAVVVYLGMGIPSLQNLDMFNKGEY